MDLRRFLGKGSSKQFSADLADCHEIYEKVLAEVLSRTGWAMHEFETLSTRALVTDAGEELRIRLQIAAIERALVEGANRPRIITYPTAGSARFELPMRVMQWARQKAYATSEASLLRLMKMCDGADFGPMTARAVAEYIVSDIERAATQGEITKQLHRATEQFSDVLFGNTPMQYEEDRRLAKRIRKLLYPETAMLVDAGDDFGRVINEDCERMPHEMRLGFIRLLDHTVRASAKSPSKKWVTTAKSMIEAIGQEKWLQYAERWLEASTNLKTGMGIDNANCARALMWCLNETRGLSAARIAEIAMASYRKIPQWGMRCEKLGNACVNLLAERGDLEAAAQLSTLASRVKAPKANNVIHYALTLCAHKSGTSLDELAEISAPTFDMLNPGRISRTVGDFEAEIVLTTRAKPRISWKGPSGRVQDSVPAKVKQHNAEELKALRQTASEAESALLGARDRVERMLLTGRTLSGSVFLERYIQHPLLAIVCRRLIWQSDAKSFIYSDGYFQSVDGVRIEIQTSDSVALWHPATASTDEVLSWRNWLFTNEITQPFKQAHREIYLLTDAERATGTYSNRFAAHIVKQHQFAALARSRGWRCTLVGGFDSESVASIQLNDIGLTAEFLLGYPAEGTPMSETGIYTYVPTDQVRFFNEGSRRGGPPVLRGAWRNEPAAAGVPLQDIPPLVFSEIMRDADLFVSVASVGADPSWYDRGEVATYWQSYAFGDLTQNGETRKEIIGSLLPRLAFGRKCQLSGKFLIVNGTKRTYKIHLGSGNIMMEPNDQYLCIVPVSGFARDNLYLPFEGDTLLSIIISKAKLLAEDDKITDPVILNQLRTK